LVRGEAARGSQSWQDRITQWKLAALVESKDLRICHQKRL
jgi:hypothetical protein